MSVDPRSEFAWEMVGVLSVHKRPCDRKRP